MQKGSIKADPALTCNFEVKIGALIPLLCTRVTGLESALTTTVLPDQTVVSTSQVKPSEGIEMDIPAHHDAEILALEALYALAQAGGPLNKVAATVYMQGANGGTKRTFLLVGLLCKGRKPPELNAKSDGEGAVITWMFACDSVGMI